MVSSWLFLSLLLLCSFQFTLQHPSSSLSFPLTSAPLSQTRLFLSSKTQVARRKKAPNSKPLEIDYQSPFRYSVALIVSLPIGTPPQNQEMVVDTGSQLSWIQCHRKTFDPSLSSSFSELPCTHPICKPRIPDFTIPTTCDQNSLCHYSYFYADGTLAEGNLVREKFTFSASQNTPPLILGCATSSADAEGILGMNLGRLSFVSQAKVSRFSYCVPPRRPGAANPQGRFYLGPNPNSRAFRYTALLNFPESYRKPNFDPLAYTVGLVSIRVGGKPLDIPPATFRPDASGAGQTMIDSGTQYTFLVDAAYAKVREEVAQRAGPKLKPGYVFGGSLDMCFNGGDVAEIGRLIGDMAFEFEGGVEVLIPKDRVLDDVGGGIHCVGIGRSESLGVASNIIGNFHQQNHWVEFDVANRRVGFGVADCTRTN